MPQKILSILESAMQAGSKVNRYGEVVMVIMETTVFVTTSQEFQIAGQWGRGKTSLGNKNKDRSAIIGKLEHVVARSGSGIPTKGTNKVLQKIVGIMEQSGFDIKDYVLPPTLFEDIEIKKKKPKEGEEGAAPAEGSDQKPEEPKAS